MGRDRIKKKLVSEVSTNALREVIKSLHGCDSTWIESVPVRETFEGETVWEGTVQVFDLKDHPTAKRCYVWSHTVGDSNKRRFVAVLHQGPIDSPQAAVRAAIVQEAREQRS